MYFMENMQSNSTFPDEQLLLQLIYMLQFEAAGRDGHVTLITESCMEEESIIQSWIALVQSIGVSLHFPDKVLRGVDLPKLDGNLEHFLSKYTDDKFKEHFRVNKTTYMFLLTSVQTALEANGDSVGKPRIRGDIQLAATLWLVFQSLFSCFVYVWTHEFVDVQGG